MKDASLEKGFTLIELLVVISIISLLSAIVLANLNSARQKAQASVVIQSVNQLQNALELYYNQFGQYPNPYPPGGDYFDAAGSQDFQTALKPLVTNGYIGQIPDYPTFPNNGPGYGGGFFEYETDQSTFNGNTLVCGNIPWTGKGYVLSVDSPYPLNLPHLGEINSDGSITDLSVSLGYPYYYCVTAP